jgi:uncharacterized protein (TIGR02687 family)
MKRIHESLQRAFQRSRIVFWYDGTGEWKETFEAFTDAGVAKLTVQGNEFGTKVRIVRDPNPEAKFLVYLQSARPADADNWLLDLLLEGYEYKADRASLDLQEVGLPYEFLYLAQEHTGFFRSEKRIRALKDLISKDDQAREIRLKLMAVLAGTEVDVDAMLLRFLSERQEGLPFDPVGHALEPALLTEYFWREVERAFGYTANAPSLRDFAVSLFRGANPLDKGMSLHPHAKVFLQRWKDSQAYSSSFRIWSRQMENELRIKGALDEADERTPLGDSDVFEIFEKFSLHRLCKSFVKGVASSDLKAGIQQRRTSFWLDEHKAGYDALEQAVELRELLSSAELAIDSLEAGFNRYAGSWWRVDMAYRRCTLCLRRYGQVNLMEPIAQWVEKAYVNNFLLPLTDRWSDRVRTLDSWECEGLLAQRRFFVTHVQPFLSRGQKVFVIISDALRYEAAMDFAQQLRAANRWTADVEAMLGSLPSYTQLGMASLLPGSQLSVDATTANVSVNGRSTVGTANRGEILSLACSSRATAIQSEQFLELNTKTDGRALMRDHDVIYIYHNTVDKVGDSATTEAKTFDAIEQTFKELDLIIRKVANINGSNMLLTADHGFLFQQDHPDDNDMVEYPSAGELTCRNRRFAFGRSIVPNNTVKVFSSTALGLEGNWAVAFPLSLGRFPLKGSGKRYVHGGTSLQEVVVPMVRIHKARTDDIEQVEVELLNVPTKITTGQVSISLFQDRPAIDKVLPRTLRVGIFAKDGTALSEIKTLKFDSKDEEARLREIGILLVLSHAADAFNNQEVDLRLQETVQGTNHSVTYKMQSLKLHKPFASDFDEF